MAHFGSKGYYVQELKKLGITHIEGRKLESFKSYVLMNFYFEKTKEATQSDK